MPVLTPRSNSASAPVSSTEEDNVNPAVMPRRGSFSRPPNFTPVSTFTSLPPNESLIHHRIDLLNDSTASSLPSIALLKMEINSDSGELYGDDVTPPAQTKDPRTPVSRAEQRFNVGYRKRKRDMKQDYHLSEVGELLRNRLIRRTDRRLAAENARIDRAEQARAIAAREKQAQVDIANASSGNFSDEQKAQLELQARLQRRVAAKEATRQRELADNAALLNNPALRGLGLTLNPDFIAASNSEEDPEEEDEDATITELETMEPIHLDLSDISNLTLAPSTLTATDPRRRNPSLRLIPILSPTRSTSSLTLFSPRTSYQSPPEEPIKRAQEALTRASNGQTMRERSVS
jgi:hypothetical protein